MSIEDFSPTPLQKANINDKISTHEHVRSLKGSAINDKSQLRPLEKRYTKVAVSAWN